jgi:hypothetical protein
MRGVLGAVVVTPIVLLESAFEGSFAASGLVATSILTAGLLVVLRKAAREDFPAPIQPVSNFNSVARSDRSCGLAVASFSLAMAKLALSPLWSWDHFAIWGFKARKILSHGSLDLGFLRLAPMSVPSYPIGVPVVWRFLVLGVVPEPPAFRLIHAATLAGIVVLLRRAVLAAGGSKRMANLSAAFVSLSPVCWDTVSLGLADAPLSLVALAALVVTLESGGRRVADGWVAGALLGFLPWIKQEGWTLALGLFAVLAVRSVLRREFTTLLRAGVVFLLYAGASVGLACAWLGPGVRFWAGDWAGRLGTRLQHPGPILLAVGREFLSRDFFGFWIAFLSAAVLAVIWRNEKAIEVGLAVLFQAAACTAIYFLTFLDPVDHVRSSLFRVLSGLLPIAMVSVAAVASMKKRHSSGVRRSLGADQPIQRDGSSLPWR